MENYIIIMKSLLTTKYGILRMYGKMRSVYFITKVNKSEHLVECQYTVV